MTWRMITSVVRLLAFISKGSEAQGAWGPLLVSPQGLSLGLRSFDSNLKAQAMASMTMLFL